MIQLIFEEDCTPRYMTEHSSACDLVARTSLTIAAGKRAMVPSGVRIGKVEWEKVPKGFVPEIQIRARSGLAIKHGICLANGVGTVDADFPDEISVLLMNTGDSDFVISKGDRIAQMVLTLVSRFETIPVGGSRKGGFGSTGN